MPTRTYFFSFKDLFDLKVGVKSDRERSSIVLFTPKMATQSKLWDKRGARSFLPVTHVDVRGPRRWTRGYLTART